MTRLLSAVALLAGITLLGALGYVAIEGWGFLDALFMSVTTLATVGYGVVHPLSDAGRIYTVVLIVVGVGVTIYLLTAIAELVLEGRLRELVQRRAMQRRIDSMSRHIIVCGFGRYGRVVVGELQQAGEPVVVIERDPALGPELDGVGAPYLIGSGLADDVLERAGIRRARALVIATASDSDNVFIALSARELAPSLEIHARGESEAAVRRLHRAGANHVTSIYSTAGSRAAACILQPTVVQFLEVARPRQGAPVDLEEIRVLAGSSLVGQTLAEIERETRAVRVVALDRAGDRILLVPEGGTAVREGDELVVIGEREPLQGLAERARAKGSVPA